MPTPGSMITFDHVQFTRAARPTFASQVEPPSSLLFVDATSKKSGSERRMIRRHIMHAVHEARRRHKIEDCDEANAVIRVQSPLQEASFAGADPFDSLPVKNFSGMHDLLGYYFEYYPGAAPLTDDKLLRSVQKRGQARRVNTQWDIISSDETCMVALVSSLARIRAGSRSDKQAQNDYFRLQQRTLKSLRERMPSPTAITKPNQISEGYIFAVMGQASVASMYLDEATAISHICGAHELIRLRGGADTLERLARRVISWCEYHSCAAHQLRPMLTPITPPGPWASTVRIESNPSTSASFSHPSPFPPAFVAVVSAAHACTAAHLPPPPTTATATSSSPRTNDDHDHHPQHHLISRIFAALTLVGTAISAAWQPAFQAYSPAKEAAGAVLDDALYAVLVEVARLHQEEEMQLEEQQQDDDRDDDDDGDDYGAVAGAEAAAATEATVTAAAAAQQQQQKWAHAVLLHAAHAYLWAALSDLPTSPHMHDAFLSRLRGALEGKSKRARDASSSSSSSSSAPAQQLGGGGGGGLSAGWMWRPVWVGSENNRRAIVAAGPMDAETLMWVLAVGWFLADKRRAMYGGGEEMVGWFGDRIEELLGVVGVCERERAVGMVGDFPGTDAFRVKWEGLLRGERFCWLE